MTEAIKSVTGMAEEGVGDEGRTALAGFNRFDSEHPLHSDHTLYLTDFHGEELRIPLQL